MEQLLDVRLSNHKVCPFVHRMKQAVDNDDVNYPISPHSSSKQLPPTFNYYIPQAQSKEPYTKMLSRTAPRALLVSVRPSTRTSAITSALLPRAFAIRPSSTSQFTRSFQSSPAIRKGLHPESANPPAPNPQSSSVAGAATHITEPSPLTPEEYYEYAEHYFNVLQNELEKVQEEGSEIEAEYSVCFSDLFSVYYFLPGVLHLLSLSALRKGIQFTWNIQGF